MFRYIHSLYYSIVTITTLGYGDISPINIVEIIFVSVMAIICNTYKLYYIFNFLIFCIIILISASVVFAFIINEVSNLMFEV